MRELGLRRGATPNPNLLAVRVKDLRFRVKEGSGLKVAKAKPPSGRTPAEILEKRGLGGNAVFKVGKKR